MAQAEGEVRKYFLSRKKRLALTVIALTVALAVLLLMHLAAGPTLRPPQEVITASMRGDPIASYRVWRAASAALAGAALATSGLLVQAATRNPIADPYILGISSGALFAVTLTFLKEIPAAFAIRPLAAVVGGLCAYLITHSVAKKAGYTPSSLALSGIAVGVVFSAASLLPLYISFFDAQKVLQWFYGSFIASSPETVVGAAGATALAIVAAVTLGDELTVTKVSDSVLAAEGGNPERVRAVASLVAAISASLTVAWFGVIGFVGLAAPHIGRRAVRSGHVKLLVTPVALAGALITVAADAFAKSAFAPLEIPVNIIVMMVGGPALATALISMARESMP